MVEAEAVVPAVAAAGCMHLSGGPKRPHNILVTAHISTTVQQDNPMLCLALSRKLVVAAVTMCNLQSACSKAQGHSTEREEGPGSAAHPSMAPLLAQSIKQCLNNV